jgi:hypothetical protein
MYVPRRHCVAARETTDIDCLTGLRANKRIVELHFVRGN